MWLVHMPEKDFPEEVKLPGCLGSAALPGMLFAKSICKPQQGPGEPAWIRHVQLCTYTSIQNRPPFLAYSPAALKAHWRRSTAASGLTPIYFD